MQTFTPPASISTDVGAPMNSPQIPEKLAEILTEVALLTHRVDQLDTTVKTQAQSLQTLLNYIERGKGSVWVVLAIGGLIGSAITYAALVLRIVKGA